MGTLHAVSFGPWQGHGEDALPLLEAAADDKPLGRGDDSVPSMSIGQFSDWDTGHIFVCGGAGAEGKR